MDLLHFLLATYLVTSTLALVHVQPSPKSAHPVTTLETQEDSVHASPFVPPPVPETCKTSKCLEFSKHIQQSLASNYTAMDPCLNFEKYSCDGWRASHSYRPEQVAISVSSYMSDTNVDLLHSILEGQYVENAALTDVNKTSDLKNFDKMTLAYKTCKDESAIKLYGVTPVRKILDEFETIFPVNGSALRNDSSSTELTQAITWLSKRAVMGLISAAVTADDMNPNTVIIALGASEFSLPKQYYDKGVVVANYTRAIAEMLHVISTGQPIDELPIPASKNASLFEQAQRVTSFEKIIAQSTPDPELSSDVKYYYNVKTMGDIQRLVPQISILNYFKALVPANYSIDTNRTVIVSDINYYTKLSSIIQSTSRQTLHDYFEWRLISTWSGRLHYNYTTPNRRFSNILGGKLPDARPERWRTCISEVDGILGHLLSGAFIQRAFTPKDKQLGDQIITDVKSVFAENMKRLDWMTEKTKEVAAKKVINIIQKVGYQTKNPNEANPQDLAAYYEKMPITSNYFDTGVTALEFGLRKLWNSLLKPTDRDQWEMTAPTVNAYYNPALNEIVFPAGIMQMPTFSGDLPEYVSYGGFGATAGHELTHGFDNTGALYDEVGRYRDWWDNSTTVQFQNKTSCFVKQYSQFSVEGMDGERVPVNGKLTLGENVADVGGLNAAFRAWKKREQTSYNAPLPGLEKFTNDQMFFISYANSWCESIRKEAVLKQVLSDPHAPSATRTTGSVDDSEDFKQAFNCPVKKATCDLW